MIIARRLLGRTDLAVKVRFRRDAPFRYGVEGRKQHARLVLSIEPITGI